MSKKTKKSEEQREKVPEATKPKPTEKVWWDQSQKVEYREKTYVLAFADVTPRLTDEQFKSFVRLLKRMGRRLTPGSPLGCCRHC